ncbi:hypothetical protein [Gimesia algae]|uniref:Uncharacterized protein n=1 Tax=Gimesia algae TaxID=2527971 RepID=A0A517VB96_9PLAN|nr:hypothetical protein [Gimesia algae]QDT90280.1 hypothetical protein Pan161_19300 [Gimesia algae]
MRNSFLVASIFLMIILIGTADTTARIGDGKTPELKPPEPTLDNSDVRFEGNFFGLDLSISRRADQFAKKLSADDVNWLLKNLKHKDRFAICHVILLMHWGPPASEEKAERDLGDWYGLTVEISDKVRYQLSDRDKLHALWTKALSDPKSQFKYGKAMPIDPPFKRKQKKKQ